MLANGLVFRDLRPPERIQRNFITILSMKLVLNPYRHVPPSTSSRCYPGPFRRTELSGTDMGGWQQQSLGHRMPHCKVMLTNGVFGSSHATSWHAERKLESDDLVPVEHDLISFPYGLLFPACRRRTRTHSDVKGEGEKV